MQLEFHPYAEIFPMIDDGDFDELAADIKLHGLREKIWLYQGKVLDGRNRYLACVTVKVEPEFREYTGTDALAFVLSLNVHRRHLTESQRAMAAAKIATLSKGSNQHTARAASSQRQAAEAMHVSTDSVQRARKVIEKGSKALQHAVESGELSVKKAAAVVALPKSEQLKAATQPAPAKAPQPPAEEESQQPECPDDADEDAALAAAEQELFVSAQKALGTDAFTEIKRLTAELAVVKITRDGYMNGKAAMTKLLQEEQRKTARLERKLKDAESELEKLRERVAMMEAA